MTLRDVVITGVGAVTPLGVGARTLHERWIAGNTGIEGGEAAAREFDPGAFMSRKETKRADRFTQLAQVAALEALEQAGWEDAGVEPERTGCIIGTGIGGIGTIESQHDVLREQGAK